MKHRTLIGILSSVFNKTLNKILNKTHFSSYTIIKKENPCIHSVRGCSIQHTYPQSSAVNWDNIVKTLLNLYRANIPSKFSKQWCYNFSSFLLFKAQQCYYYNTKCLCDFTKNFKKLYRVEIFLLSISMACIPFASRGDKTEKPN